MAQEFFDDYNYPGIGDPAISADTRYDWYDVETPAISADTRSDWYDFAFGVGDRIVNYQTARTVANTSDPTRTSVAGGAGGFSFGNMDIGTIAIIFGGLFLLARLVK